MTTLAPQSCTRQRFSNGKTLPVRLLATAFFFATAFLTAAAAVPVTFLLPGKNLEAARVKLAGGDTALQPALEKLRREADKALKSKPESVMDKPRAAASGNKHDYFSYGPYWWPDLSKPDGLPYIRRDGEVNPDSKKGTDNYAFVRTGSAIKTLGLAYFFTGHEPYAAQTVLLARGWFLDAATKMNPHLDYAQAIPGINNGRGIGIIETRTIATISDSLALLGSSPAWTDGDRSAYRDWLKAYAHWLKTSANGIDEQDELNNHGTWYDVQAAYLALALGKNDEAKNILTTGLKLRLTAHVQPDGAQPRELVRTKSLEYSIFNLEALFSCAQLGDSAGVDWWKYSTTDGRNLRAALLYLASYADPARPWPKKDVVEADRARLLQLFASYLAHREDPVFQKALADHAPTDPVGEWRLLWAAP